MSNPISRPPLTPAPMSRVIVSVMARLNLTLDQDTARRLDQHAKRSGKPRATLARELLREALARQEALERRQQLARDYAAGRGDARTLLGDLESAQLGLLDDEGARARRIPARRHSVSRGAACQPQVKRVRSPGRAARSDRVRVIVGLAGRIPMDRTLITDSKELRP